MAGDSVRPWQPAILLSASIPTADRAAPYFETADVIAIRDCIKALVSIAVPRFSIVWGGHPSITPMIRILAESNHDDVVNCFVLYQSSVFRKIAPKDNEYFRNIVWVEGGTDVPDSLISLRTRMIHEQNYVAAAFIGGMEGIEIEFNEFRETYPNLPVFPIATTGGAAKVLFDQWSNQLKLPSSLKEETAYPFLWRRLLDNLSPG